MHRSLGRLLLQLHSPCYAWVYMLWLLLAYAPVVGPVVALNEDFHVMHSKRLFNALFLLPVALAVWQAFYPTLGGWFVFTVPTVLWTGLLLILNVRLLLTTHLQGFWAHQDFTLGCILGSADVLAIIALLYGRPRPSTLTRVA